MNKTMTKVLSFVLALALVAAFAPAGVISNADAAIGSATTYLLRDAKGTSFTTGTAGTNWSYHSALQEASSMTISSSGEVQFRANGSGRYVVLNITLPAETGEYRLDVRMRDYLGASEVDAYVFPSASTAAEGMVEANKLGTVTIVPNGKNDDGGEYLPVVGKTIKVTAANAGTSIAVAITPTKAGDNYNNNVGTHGMYFQGLRIVKTAELALELDVVETTAVATLPSGQTTVSAIAKMTDGAEATNAVITFASSNTKIATVDANTGVVTQVGNGNVTITATVTLEGVTKTASVDIYCGEIIWAGAGAVEVYDFTKICDKATIDTVVKIGSVTDYSGANANWYEVPGQSVCETSETDYKVSSYNTSRLGYYATNANSVFAPVIKLPSTPGKYVVSMQYLPTGIASGEGTNGKPAAGGLDINLYLWPKNETTTGNVVNMMTDEYLIGSSYRIYGTDSNTATPNLAVVSITPEMAGKEYILGLNATVPGTSSSWCGNYGFVIENFTFTGAGSEVLKTVTLTGGETIAEVGDTAQLALTKKLSDGSDATAATVTYASDNTDFTVSDTGLVTANGYGTANITATVSLDTITRVEKVTVEVAPPVVEEDFEGSANSGYYADAADADVKEGIIAFNALFNKYNEIAIDSYGFYVYEEGNEDAEVGEGKVEKSTNGALADGWFHVTVTEIAEADFDRVAVAIPFVVIDGNVYYGDAITSSTAANWLGAKA